MNSVYVVHEQIPYEFGRVRGVFATENDAIAYAETLIYAEELTVSRWTVCLGQQLEEGVEVWEKLGRDKPGKRSEP